MLFSLACGLSRAPATSGRDGSWPDGVWRWSSVSGLTSAAGSATRTSSESFDGCADGRPCRPQLSETPSGGPGRGDLGPAGVPRRLLRLLGLGYGEAEGYECSEEAAAIDAQANAGAASLSRPVTA